MRHSNKVKRLMLIFAQPFPLFFGTQVAMKTLAILLLAASAVLADSAKDPLDELPAADEIFTLKQELAAATAERDALRARITAAAVEQKAVEKILSIRQAANKPEPPTGKR